MERVIQGIHNESELQYILSSRFGWVDRAGESSNRIYIEDVCDGQTIEVGRLPTFGRIHLQQWVSSIIENEPI
jgi:hypothetical protein